MKRLTHMRILYCNKYNFAFSGTEVYLFELMDLMRSYGHHTALFSMANPRGQPAGYDQHLVPAINFKSANPGLFGSARLGLNALYSRQARQKARDMIEEFRPDVAHVRNIYHHLSPSILWELKAQGVPVVYHLNDFKLLCPSYNMVSHGRACERCHGGKFRHVITEGCYSGPPGATLALAAEAYLHKWLRSYETCVDRFIAPSRFVKQKLVENGWDAGKISVLPHFQNLSSDAIFEPAGDAPILYFGRLSEEKGLTDLLRAMQKLPAISLQIAGEGPQRNDLEALSNDLELRNVEFVGQLSGQQLDEAISSSRFTVMPSLAYETLGKTILESYARGRAVVASDLGSRRELIHEGKTGILFPPGRADELAGAISFLAERPSLAAAMGLAGRTLVANHHSPATHYSELIKLYEQLAPAPRKTSGHESRKLSTPGLRVAFIGGRGVISKYSGIETYYEEIGARLAEMGHEVTVYCRTYFSPPQAAYNGMRLVRLPTIRSKHLETLVHTLLSTIHAAFGDSEIVHYQCLGPALFSFIPRWFGKKTVVTVQGLDWQRRKWGRLASAILQLGERASIRLPDQTMVVSRTLQEYYRAHYGAEPVYVPNGTTLRQRRKGERLRDWDLEPGKYILFLGRFSPEKNCDLLIRAYEQMDTPVKLVLAGGSSHSDRYAKKMRAHQSENIRILDWVSGEALDELLTNAMLFVLPSDMEGLSLALLDAMGAGVCVLASDVPENRELVDDGSGFTFRHGDQNDLERMLRLLISEPQVRQAAAAKARERVWQHYLWGRVAREIEGVYLTLAARNNVPKPAAPGHLPDYGHNAA
jgi:glycosyltransferase involved in cell wall biosynthesis